MDREHLFGRTVRARWLPLLLIVGFSMLLFQWQGLSGYVNDFLLDSFPIRNVRVEGDVRYTASENFIGAVSAAFVGESYFSVNLASVVAAARSVSWIKDVQAERVWPDTIILRVKEHLPVARWGADQLLDLQGERFSPSKIAEFSNLPALQAPAGAEKELLVAMDALNEQLEAEGVKVISLARNERRAWVAGLSNNAELIFGRQNPVLAFRYFMGLAPKLAGRKLIDIRRLDLRYPNGFSIVWRDSIEAVQIPSAEL